MKDYDPLLWTIIVLLAAIVVQLAIIGVRL